VRPPLPFAPPTKRNKAKKDGTIEMVNVHRWGTRRWCRDKI
jgi:hypothetical protein